MMSAEEFKIKQAESRGYLQGLWHGSTIALVLALLIVDIYMIVR